MSGIGGIQNSGTAAVDDSRQNSRANLDKAAQQFEAVFVNLMLKQARQAAPDGGLIQSDALNTFREMQDRQLSGEMAKHSPLGIAEALTTFLERGRQAKGSEPK
ncbi:rod-binding protein [Sphingosinicella soli]|uniref:Flagellar protein FlgJ n=1 Tax=Sphingosinicella soli TaxID=333708 RepID=A0A7W7B2J7_9SPHN|nr:rod-binding protein [Sphingosinicella soli]MBB4632844.1 flagellar protein FlgJ [Sphingosinicella soli]